MPGCTFKGHDESINATNRGNFIEMINFIEIAKVVLENAPQTDIQKELLSILANKVQDKICEEIRDAKFCILVDEALDESNKEQMAIILRFVDLDGFVRERFFQVMGVDDTNATTR